MGAGDSVFVAGGAAEAPPIRRWELEPTRSTRGALLAPGPLLEVECTAYRPRG